MEQEIIEYLKARFNPTAIILHGSRASGHERVHSDWDFVLLYEEDCPHKNGRVECKGENIEYSHHNFPVVDVMAEFSVKLMNARVVFEKSEEGSSTIKQAQAVYAEPLGWTEEEKYSHSLWMRGRIEGMKESLSQPLLFEKYAADFYQRIHRYWYWAIHDKYPLPIYLAHEEIKNKDIEYYSLIEQFVSDANESRVSTATQIFERCFGK